MTEGNDAFELAVIIVRRVRTRRGAERHRSIEHSVVRRESLIDRRGVDVRLERRAHLAFRLDSAIELRLFEVAPPDHSLYVAGGVIQSEQCALHSRFLFQRYAAVAAIQRNDLYIHQIAASQELLRRSVACPL